MQHLIGARAKKAAVTTLIIALFLLVAPMQIFAANTNSFTVGVILPENQIDRKQSYFDLRMEPGQEQIVQIRVDNPGRDPITVSVSLNAAATGQDGVVVYTEQGIRDDSMRLSIVDVATVGKPKTVVEARGSALIDVRIAMPDQVFDGVLLGGINLSAETPLDEEPASGSVQIRNEYVYVVGLQLRYTDAEVLPELHLRDIVPGLNNYRTALTVRLQNSEAVQMRDMQLLAQVYRDGHEEVYREKLFERANMAPNSTGDFVVSWDSNALEAGNYRLYLRAEHEQRVWEWDERFAIGAGLAQDANSGAVNLKHSRFTALPYIIFFAGVILLAVYYIRKQSQRRRIA